MAIFRVVLLVMIGSSCRATTPETPPNEPTTRAATSNVVAPAPVLAGATPGPAEEEPIANVAPPSLVPPAPVAPPMLDPSCPLDWDDLAATMPAKIPLAIVKPDAIYDDCMDGFDPAALLEPDGCLAPGCDLGKASDGRRIAIETDGPHGSGRFWSVWIVVDGPVKMVACLGGSTVAWRHLYPVAKMIGPLPWSGDLDADGATELFVWTRLSWGNSEMENSLIPIAYAVEGTALVRHDERARPLAQKVATAYKALAKTTTEKDVRACHRATARALDQLGAKP